MIGTNQSAHHNLPAIAMNANPATFHRTHDKVSIPAGELLQGYISDAQLTEGDRLPPERILAAKLGVSRGNLRQALAAAEATGEIWRHVGKGTFVGSLAPSSGSELASQLARHSNPTEVIEARTLLEPKLAALAALRGTPQSFAALQMIVSKGLAAQDPKASHVYGNEFHHAIARMAGNHLLMGLFEAIFKVRDLNSWGKLRPALSTKQELAKLWEQHHLIAQAIVSRDAREAEALTRLHIDELHRSISAGQDALLASRPQHAWPSGLQNSPAAAGRAAD
jgi:DNA-binding FadR family transcriptional regulator